MSGTAASIQVSRRLSCPNRRVEGEADIEPDQDQTSRKARIVHYGEATFSSWQNECHEHVRTLLNIPGVVTCIPSAERAV